MKRLKITLLLAHLFVLTASAQVADVLVDFEDKETGSVMPVFSLTGSSAAVAVVADDPAGGNRKHVVHVTTANDARESGLNIRLANLPSGYTLSDYDFIAFDYYRGDNDSGSAKAYVAMNGREVWRDPVPGPYEQKGKWFRRVLSLESLAGNTKTRIMPLHIGLLGGGKDYYIDNIRLVRDIDYGYDLDNPTTTLRYYADRLGLNVGVAMADGDNFFYSGGYVGRPESQWTRAFTGLFNATVCGNEMKWEAIEPRRGEFNFERPDQLVDLALSHGMKVRGHTLCWHAQLAGWVYDIKDRDDMLAALKHHILTVVGHYKGKVYEWDVCNEMIDAGVDDGLCRDIFCNVIGPDYLDSCFVWAHRADPDARLVMNDFLVEYNGDAKAMKLFRKAVQMKRDGIPIDGVGYQCHCYWLGAIASMKVSILGLLKLYERYGLDVSFTEMDQGLSYDDRDKLSAWEAQANDYRALMEIAVKAPNVHTLIVWGMTDPYSWRPTFDGAQQPLLLGDYIQAKPAYFAMLDVLREAAEATGISSLSPNSSPIGWEDQQGVYDLQGRRVPVDFQFSNFNSQLNKGLYIINGKKVLIK